MKRLKVYDSIVLTVLLALTPTLGQYPASPCSNIFQYQRWQNTIYGLIKITPPVRSSPTESIILEVSLSLGALLPNKNIGSLELHEDQNLVFSRLQNNYQSPILYRIIFPLSYPIPALTKIDVNGRTVCEGPPDVRSKYVETTLFLHYTISFKDGPSSLVYDDKPNDDNLNTPTIPQRERPSIVQPKAQCGRVENFIHLVVNGTDTERGEWPWMTAIFVLKKQAQQFQCGGSLISLNHILTAAHCVNLRGKSPIKPNEIVINLGSFLLQPEESTQFRYISEIYVHPSYNTGPETDNDIAILVLSRPAKQTNFVTPVCLWSETDTRLEKVINTEGSVVGWGRNEKGEDKSDQLKLTKMPVVSQEECLRSNPSFSSFTSDTTYCAGQRDGSGPCSGDSGGGMFFKQYVQGLGTLWMLRGVVSLALTDGNTKSCDLTNYVVFTDVAKFLPWIKKMTGII